MIGKNREKTSLCRRPVRCALQRSFRRLVAGHETTVDAVLQEEEKPADPAETTADVQGRAVAQVEHQRVNRPGLKPKQLFSFQSSPEVGSKDRILSVGHHPDLGQGVFDKIDAVPATEDLGSVHALEVRIDGETSRRSDGQTGAAEQIGELHSGGDDRVIRGQLLSVIQNRRPTLQGLDPPALYDLHAPLAQGRGGQLPDSRGEYLEQTTACYQGDGSADAPVPEKPG